MAEKKAECERCLKEDKPRHRVKTDALDIKVCDDCAKYARELGLPVSGIEGGSRDAADI